LYRPTAPGPTLGRAEGLIGDAGDQRHAVEGHAAHSALHVEGISQYFTTGVSDRAHPPQRIVTVTHGLDHCAGSLGLLNEPALEVVFVRGVAGAIGQLGEAAFAVVAGGETITVVDRYHSAQCASLIGALPNAPYTSYRSTLATEYALHGLRVVPIIYAATLNRMNRFL
jgi:hypothetical protein